MNHNIEVERPWRQKDRVRQIDAAACDRTCAIWLDAPLCCMPFQPTCQHVNRVRRLAAEKL
jgi:hypothetical protein